MSLPDLCIFWGDGAQANIFSEDSKTCFDSETESQGEFVKSTKNLLVARSYS